jgi:hypothetical protein
MVFRRLLSVNTIGVETQYSLPIMTMNKKTNGILTNVDSDDEYDDIVQAIVDEAKALPEVLPVPQKPKRASKLVPIPDYFLKLDKHMAATHILCLDKENTEVATHLSSVPLSQYNSLDPLHVIPLEKFGVNKLRNMCTFFNRMASGNLKECLALLSAVKKEPNIIAKIMEIDVTEKDIDIMNRSRHAFRMTTLIFGCKDRSEDFGNLNKDRNRTVLELKLVDNFYAKLCNDTNNQLMNCHKLILPYENPLLQDVYDAHLKPDDPEKLGIQHPMHPVSPILLKNAPAFLMFLVKLRNNMVRMLTKSGTHDTDAYEYTGLALKQGKKPRFVTKEALYYFYMQGDLNYSTMESFTPSLPKGITGANFASAESQGMTAKKQQQISAAKFDEMQSLLTVELEERKLLRVAKLAEKDQKQKERVAEKEYKWKAREQDMQIAAIQHADAKRDAYIVKLEVSIEKLAKQQFRCVRLIDQSSKDETVEYLKEELQNVKDKKHGYEKTLLQLEQEKMASLSSNSFPVLSRTPFKMVNDNMSTHTLLLNRANVNTPMFYDDPTLTNGLLLNRANVNTPMFYDDPTLTNATNVESSDPAIPTAGNAVIAENPSLAALLAVVAGGGSSGITNTNEIPRLNGGRMHCIPRHKKARVATILEPTDDSSTSSDVLDLLPFKKSGVPGVPVGYEDAVDETESQPLIFLGRKGVPL